MQKGAIMEQLYEQIKSLAKKHHAQKVVLFGSRARGDNHQCSDIDLAIYDMPEPNQALFSLDIEDLPTLLKFDLVYITPFTNPKLIENINKEGVVLYEKL